jgi:hypothetical protein
MPQRKWSTLKFFTGLSKANFNQWSPWAHSVIAVEKLISWVAAIFHGILVFNFSLVSQMSPAVDGKPFLCSNHESLHAIEKMVNTKVFHEAL